jgi:hypothetical protein
MSNEIEQTNSSKNPPSSGQIKSRRELLKALAATGGAVAASGVLSGQWVKPVVEVGVLPAHAQISGALTFNYTGGVQTFVVPPGVTRIRARLFGAQGGVLGGLGGEVEASNITVTPGETLTITVGGQGADNGGATGGAGGFGGGGNGGNGDSGFDSGAAGGGGMSAIYAGGTPLIVAGGGGGGGGTLGSAHAGGNGGGNLGQAGFGVIEGGGGGASNGPGGTGAGTGSNGGAGSGGDGGSDTGIMGSGGGGGGGGYFGGGGGSEIGGDPGGGGGGGASYVMPGATVVINNQGVRPGNGQVVISW